MESIRVLATLSDHRVKSNFFLISVYDHSGQFPRKENIPKIAKTNKILKT